MFGFADDAAVQAAVDPAAHHGALGFRGGGGAAGAGNDDGAAAATLLSEQLSASARQFFSEEEEEEGEAAGGVGGVAQLREGVSLLKYGRRGAPKQRELWLTKDGLRLNVNAAGDLATKGVNLSDVLELSEGCKTGVFGKRPSAHPARCFSIVARERSFDFECASERQCARVLGALASAHARAQRTGFALPKGGTKPAVRSLVD
jgi:hypothetical protein